MVVVDEKVVSARLGRMPHFDKNARKRKKYVLKKKGVIVSQ